MGRVDISKTTFPHVLWIGGPRDGQLTLDFSEAKTKTYMEEVWAESNDGIKIRQWIEYIYNRIDLSIDNEIRTFMLCKPDCWPWRDLWRRWGIEVETFEAARLEAKAKLERERAGK